MAVYITTTDKSLIPGNAIAMVDGTVPGWLPKDGDLHFDHHRPGGAAIQLWEIPRDTKLPAQAVFVTTQTDADACAAAAWLQLVQMDLSTPLLDVAYRYLSAIAYDCDHLGLPQESEWDNLREFAAKAVAALKESGGVVAKELGLPENRKDWNDSAKAAFSSECFKRGTEWLIDACLGERTFPGENGEADPYFERMNSMRSKVYENCRLYKGCAIFDQRSFDGYVDPRLLVEWTRAVGATEPITLTVRSGVRLPNASFLGEDQQSAIGDDFVYSYTLGSIPLHAKGSPKFSDRDVWRKLQILEAQQREIRYQRLPETSWGGRNEVGGSGWRDPAIAHPEQVIDSVLACP
jgi:hypothetical protein